MGQWMPYDPSEIPGGFLNNFFIRFFIGDDPYERSEEMRDGVYRSYAKKTKGVYRDWTMEFYSDGSEFWEDVSDKRLDQTNQEFIDDIDRAIVEVGLTVESVGKVLNIYFHFRGISDEIRWNWKMTKSIDAFLLPIYIALRKKGYNKQDLCG